MRPWLIPFIFLLVPLTAKTIDKPSQASVRERMLRIALEQSEKPAGEWDPAQRDCAGFIRFVYRAALDWHGPLFRQRSDGSRSLFLSARDLISGDFERIGRDVHDPDLRTGDVLAFFNPAKPSPDDWHLMLVLEPPRGAPSQRLVIYHNGALGANGAVKKAWIEDLWNSAETYWRPRPGNPAFVGVFRWKGWRELYESPQSRTEALACADATKKVTQGIAHDSAHDAALCPPRRSAKGYHSSGDHRTADVSAAL